MPLLEPPLSTPTGTPDTETAAPGVEPDALFRLQMAVSDFVIGNAKNFGYALAIGLGCVGVWAAWDTWTTSAAEEDFGAIAAIDFKMPKASQLADLGLEPADDPADANRIANVQKGAELYEQAAAEASGTAAVFAWLKAAETWERLGKDEQRLAALAKAHEIGAGELPGYSAASAYAAALADAGRTDEAIAVLRAQASSQKDFYAEESLIALAQLQVNAGKAAEASGVIAEFRQRFPSSPRTARLDALGPLAAGGATPAPSTPAPAAPADAPPAAPAPGSGG